MSATLTSANVSDYSSLITDHSSLITHHSSLPFREVAPLNTYFALFLIAVFSSLTITPLIRRLCERFKLLDVPADGRRVHTKSIPRLGGVAVFLSVMIALSTLPLVDNLLTQSLKPLRSELL